MNRFGPDPHHFFDSAYRETPPWDVGGPQPALASLLTDFPPESPILDIGCGSGDLAIYLAQAGFDVLGIDFIEAAINTARQKAGSLPPEVTRRLDFQVADGLQLPGLAREFGSVVDSGFYHLFDPEQCDELVSQLAFTLRPEGRYYLLAFAMEFTIPNSPRGVTEAELRGRFTAEKGWRIREIRPAQFMSHFPPVPAICACLERAATPRA